MWIHNSYVFLDSHPSLTAKQRAAVKMDIAYVQLPHVFDHASADIVAQAVVQDAAAALEAAVGDADFSPDLIVTAFLHLGPIPPARSVKPFFDVAAELSKPQSSPRTYPDCMCRSNVGCWEYYATYCDYLVYCVPVPECGFNGTMPCEGVCTNGPPEI